MMGIDLEISSDHLETFGAMTFRFFPIIYDNSRVIRMMIVSDINSCGITYEHHSDNSRVVIYAPRELLKDRHHL